MATPVKTLETVADVLENKLTGKTAQIGVVGLGYTGLPLAIAFAKAGFEVTGIDVDADRVDGIRSGKSYLKDVKNAAIRALIDRGRLLATADFSVVASLDVIHICVPTPLTRNHEPDMTYIVAATEAIAQHLSPQKLIILESTTYPGTTEEILKPILEKTGLKAGQDFFLAYSPERIDPGNKDYTVRNTPKIISGHTPRCMKYAELLYKQVVDQVVPVSSLGCAELAKLFENIFRNVNIALVNELALLCQRLDINVWEVIDAAATKPFGFMKFVPGPGLGGHCIPVDPFYLAWKAKQHGFYTEFIELAGKINENMPYYVVSRIADALNSHKKALNGAEVLLIGVAYKRDISDIRESPALKIIELLEQKGACISYHDLHVPTLPPAKISYESLPLSDEILKQSDCAVIITDHSEIDCHRIARTAALVVDTRNALAGIQGNHIFRI